MTPLYGTFSAIVVSAQDPQNRGRARLRIPQVMGTAVSGWAEPVVLGATLPGDQVYVSFDGGDRNFPIFWPKVRIGVQGWIPLALGSGWTAGANGTPTVRLGEDGVIELDGSISATTISVGISTKFSSLPGGLLPLHRVMQPVATNYRTGFTSTLAFGEYRATTSTASTTYVTDANGPVATFVAPGTGAVVITFGSFMQNSTATGRAIMGIQIKDGSTVVTGPDDNRSAENQSDNNSSVANALTYASLTAGRTYTATAMYRTDVATNTASFDNKWIEVAPTVPNNSPLARVSIETNGDLNVLFPAGHYTPYETSLSGVRARAV
ncbi:phage baseplate assembly protein V [Streptomyces sp. NPDC006632]|uniref:phage baseplate assembly protein V n=1 Tax=Streptomyces sp. NPDC006632 TaxID=3157182 RepID=UPI0033B222A7